MKEFFTTIWGHIQAVLPQFGMYFLEALAIILVGGIVIRILTRVIGKALHRGSHGHSLLVHFVESVISKVCWLILGMMTLKRVGIDVTPLLAGLGATGIIIGFACQESLSNFAAGLMIAFNEPFRVGDFIEAGGCVGTVKDVNLMATILSTPDNKKVIIPNKTVWGSAVTNYSANGQRRVDLTVSVAYGSNLAQVTEVIRKALEGVEGVLPEPAPTVCVGALADSGITFNYRPWATVGDYWAVYHRATLAVEKALEAAKIEIPFPQLVVHTANEGQSNA